VIRKRVQYQYVGSVVLCFENVVCSNVTCCSPLLSEWVKHVTYLDRDSILIRIRSGRPGLNSREAQKSSPPPLFPVSDPAGCWLRFKAAGAWNLPPLSIYYTHFSHTYGAVHGAKGQHASSLLCVPLRRVCVQCMASQATRRASLAIYARKKCS
jgi:hypothetical protein